MELSVWAIFLLSAASVVLAGVRLSRDGDVIAEHTGLGHTWVGAILLAGVTSLPELITNIYAVGQGNRNLAAGDLFGSNMINMLILALADLSARGVGVLTRVSISQILVSSVSIALMAIAAIGIATRDESSVLGLSWAALGIGFGYVAAGHLLHATRPEADAATAAREPSPGDLPWRSVAGFLAAAAVIFVAAGYLASSSAQIAETLGVATGFVGVALVALVTSLPEVAVSIAAMRSGAHDLAVGNLLGSNCFNMAIFVVLDVVDGPGSVFSRIDPSMLVTVLFAMLLSGLAALEIANRGRRTGLNVPPIAGLMVLAYVVGLYLSYSVGH